jgi:DNA-binding winged helix-turn-helix (wHTH) protein
VTEKEEAMIYTFGDYELDTFLYELRCAGTVLKIEPQVFNVLAYLIQHCDRTVTRQELLEQLWPEPFVNEAVLSYHVMAARKAVGDSGRTQRVIKTVHGRGFRFVALLRAHGHEPSSAEARPAAEPPGCTEQPQPGKAMSETASFVAASSVPGGAPVGAPALVTVLCATLATTIAPEPLGFAESQRLRQAFFAVAQSLAQQYHGTPQFFGADGILVLFGVTETSTEHARRAMRAAMELQQRLQALDADLRAPQVTASAVRMGLHTGPVAEENLASDQPRATTAMGETMHLAVWLQYLTEPGTLLTSEATMHLLQEEIPYVARREVHVPGQPQPVKTYTIRVSGL